MKIIDNFQEFLGDDLKESLKENSRLNISAAYFSIYAYEELKDQLNKIDEMNFLFTSPTFVKDRIKKERREFFIPKLKREKSISGTEFEVKLRNELTQKAIAKECSEWIQKKAKFKSIVSNNSVNGFICVDSEEESLSYAPIEGFSTVDLGYEKGNSLTPMINKIDEYPLAKQYYQKFDEIWNDEEKLEEVTDQVIDYISTVYNENSPEFIYFITLYNIFNEFLEDINEDVLPNESVGFKDTLVWDKLYTFQKDAAIGIINKLEQFNGCILADSVGLGKTFTALAVVKYYELRNKSVLVLCPKKLNDNWLTFRNNVRNNIFFKDRFRYDVLYHTDLSREKGKTNGIDLNTLMWENYDLIVIDESHNFRNNNPRKDRETRYQKLLNQVVRAGVKTKVLMLSATPVNNNFSDLHNQLALAYEGEEEKINEKLKTKDGVSKIFLKAQRAFREWSKLEATERTPENLLEKLSFDFFELLDSVTIARSRKHIEKYYDLSEIGKFPERLKPISIRTELSDIDDDISYNDIYKELSKLNLEIYTPYNHIHPRKLPYYDEIYNTEAKGGTTIFRQADRESNLLLLMRINLLKRLESSVHSFKLTLERIETLILETIVAIENFQESSSEESLSITDYENYDEDTFDEEFFDEDSTIGSKVKISLKDMDIISWKESLEDDLEILDYLIEEMKKIKPENDLKLRKLEEIIEKKINNNINSDNKKVLIFTAFADTADYLYEYISKYFKNYYSINTAKVTGSDTNKNTAGIHHDFNTILTCFSPLAKERNQVMPKEKRDIDILIGTDCISEGQNLQDCDYLINYDIHWNPVRIIQRFGRIDRIGSKNDQIQLVNFWPNLTLDEYINLKERVENRMEIVGLSSTGDNVLSNKSSDLEYRKNQLKRLQEEVVDIEEMNSGVNITDLGLNDFRMDLINYVKEHGEPNKVPFGMHSVVKADYEKDIYPGVIFILKNINDEVNIDNQNRLHPFYIVYIKENGEIHSNHLEIKKSLDFIRHTCKNRNKPIMEAYEEFNKETKDGRKMDKYSELLEESIKSIITVKEESDIDSLFSIGGTTAFINDIKGLEDFELITFLVIK